MPSLAVNKHAGSDYEILEKFEAGLKLLGHEVKSVRAGSMSLRGAYVSVASDGIWLVGAHIPRYKPAGPTPGYDPERSRKLLLHKREIKRLSGQVLQKGLTLVPLSVYTRKSHIKLEFGLARGKKQYEKRAQIRKRDLDREVRRSLKGDM
ncbi:SsrA-binding protein SmpB [Candidatus Uhrbacteria bacterium]|nr:SsrA-binding protein SmpB [Candidatus Uhrbacteria bacterium]